MDHTPQKMLNSEGWSNITSGHPWIRARHFKKPLPLPSPGLLHWGEHWFFYSPQSQIPLRRLGPSTRHWLFNETSPTFFSDSATFQTILGSWLKNYLVSRLEYKQSLDPRETCFRWIFSESDLIPGLIVDRLGSQLVCQILSAPVELFWKDLEKALIEAFQQVYQKTAEIVARRNSSVRAKEGLPVEALASGSERIWLEWNGLKWSMNPGGSQKTGSYLDQKNNHSRTAHWARTLKSQRAWDLCCFEGGFGMHLAQEKIQVLCVDQSEAALEVTRSNAEANHLSEYLRTENADIFDWVRAQSSPVDLIVLDPPSFVKDSKSKWGALKGFKELNLRAMKNLNPGGILVSCSCSHHISREDFEQMLRSAAHDCRKEFSVLEILGPSPDHSPLLHFPEGQYLQAWYLRML